MLNRWLSVKNKITKATFEGRGRYSNTQLTNTVRECESIRFEIMNEISNIAKKLRDSVIDDEDEIRGLNSDINSLLKEKYKWECRIVELGGPNYRSRHGQYIESLGGVSLPNSSLKVFGSASSLPEYRDILPPDQPETAPKIISTPKGANLCEHYYGEITKEEEYKIQILEKEKETELRKNMQQTDKEISAESILKLIKDKMNDINTHE
ncbi:conserved eukaryotic protein [Cryptosporidium canis]|uniref:Conserved eukaryotic protein n=1 Tax=Cryptosporidium canis TaxID=195482 RepID=A0ABQ8P7L2_9CRYT|nr:conserved eukaryotic protein [Cryptosporidium canis]